MAKKPAKAKAPKGGGKSDQVKNLRAARANKGQAEKDKAEKVKRAAKGTKPVPEAAERAPDARKLPSKNALKELMRDVELFEKRGATQNASARQLVGEAVKKIGVNAAAFRQVKKEIRMGGRDPVTLRTYMEDCAYYREVFGVEDLAGDSLFAPREGAEDGPGADDAGDDHNPSPGESTGEDGKGDLLPDNVTRLGGQPAAA